MSRISQTEFLRRVDEAVAMRNCTSGRLNLITEMLEKEGWANVELVEPPSLRQQLLRRYPSCFPERDRSYYTGGGVNDRGDQCSHQTPLIFASEADLNDHKRRHREDFESEVAARLMDARRTGSLDKAFDHAGAVAETIAKSSQEKGPKHAPNKPTKKTKAKLSD